MKGLNDAAIASMNRYQLGADFTVTDTMTVRAGYSYIRQYGMSLNGFVVMAFFTF